MPSTARWFTCFTALLCSQCGPPPRASCKAVVFGGPLLVGGSTDALLTTSTVNRLVLASRARGTDGGQELVVSLTDGQAVNSVLNIAPGQSEARFSVSADETDFFVAWSSLDAGFADYYVARSDESGAPLVTEVVGSGLDVPGTLPQVASGGGHTAVLWDPGTAPLFPKELKLGLTQWDADGTLRPSEVSYPLQGERHLFSREDAEWAFYYFRQTTPSGAGVIERRRVDDSGVMVGAVTTVHVLGGASTQLQALAVGRSAGQSLIAISSRDAVTRTLAAVTCSAAKCGNAVTIWSAPVADVATDRPDLSVAWVQGAYWVSWHHASSGFMAYVRSDLSIAAAPRAHLLGSDSLSIRQLGETAFAAWRTPESERVDVASLECTE